ncbi:vacuolar transporter chaperone complex subunit 2 [Trichomonascus vanleenenianus]|uniref:vacuolar transporter chaperone complex subunit 2 n=1 Tax=Trichomonascus vanleenenianus TaxID=2268995 RepID=UPI003EC9ADD6
MLFGVRLSNEIYPPWRHAYISYEKLKKLLKESIVFSDGEEQESWSEEDESRFVAALDKELEKVYSFESTHYNDLSNRIAKLEEKFDPESLSEGGLEQLQSNQVETEMEDILENATQLERFSRLNYTGFIKIVKKHDRLHPRYQVKPLLRVRLAALPFHNEDYSPLLYRLSAIYQLLADNVGAASVPNNASAVMSSFREDSDYTTMKFWVHPENVMELKTKILRRLPVLVYNPEGTYDEDQPQNGDPTITSLYFDNPGFELYESELEKKRAEGATPSLRLRWYGQLSESHAIKLERRDAESTNIKLKEKHVASFLSGNSEAPTIKKTLRKMRDRNAPQSEIDGFVTQVKCLQGYIKDHKLAPVMRTVFTRTAFEIPGDDHVRVILDSDIVFIREDSFDADRPIRDPEYWRRRDLDVPGEADPLTHVRKSEYSKFPYSVLEIRVKTRLPAGASAASAGASVGSVSKSKLWDRHSGWIEEIISSNLVKEVPQFSKFVQGIASLFAEDDRLDALPFWLSELEHDIRQDSTAVFKQHRERFNSSYQLQPAAPLSYEEDDSSDEASMASRRRPQRGIGYPEWIEHADGSRLNGMDSEDEEVILPPGVVEPQTWLKNQGAVKVEAKVWLANERTFNKWLNVTVMLSALTFALYNSVERASSTVAAERIAYVLFALTLFSGVWGYAVYMKRLKYIHERTDKHFDAPLGPLVIAVTLLVVLTVNFYYSLKNRISL